ncbi:MAG: SMI1/KNR4 family protein [Saccharospirillaceae bacterium]|nr:SMI1/KNR4 family protein [Pseudomonadales bacterium]NRB81428.1 SMI1/KNR4 family protein [Saccharospirillaceae bacterium]
MKIKIYVQIDINIDHINKFEKLIANELPSRYREFLAKNNICSVDPKNFTLPNGDPCSQIKMIYGFKKFNENDKQYLSYTMDWIFNIYTDRIHKDYLAIAGDFFGNCICIGLSEDRRGEIYFWDHEAMENEHNLTLLDNDFDSFLDSLHK